jgi:hypothetical protein
VILQDASQITPIEIASFIFSILSLIIAIISERDTRKQIAMEAIPHPELSIESKVKTFGDQTYLILYPGVNNNGKEELKLNDVFLLIDKAQTMDNGKLEFAKSVAELFASEVYQDKLRKLFQEYDLKVLDYLKEFIWNESDNLLNSITYNESLRTEKFYTIEEPGIYRVTLFVYVEKGNCYYNHAIIVKVSPEEADMYYA